VIERAIPRSGETLPVIGLGTWQTFDVTPSAYEPRTDVLRRFVELGGRLVDSSPMYGRSETAIGDVATEAGLHDQLFFATKVWTRGARDGIAQMEDSFRKLRVKRMDLLQVHNLVDVETHLRTLVEWKAAGRVRYIGVTHYTVEAHAQLEPYLARGEIDFVQFNYSLAVRDAERRLLPMAAEHGVATLINRPFESGGMFRDAGKKPLPAIAAELGCKTWSQLFLKYVASHPAVTCVIPATANVQHLEENMAAGLEPLPDATMREAIAQAWDR
jgi:diketogulonate reductase-like aldo/keto reductase